MIGTSVTYYPEYANSDYGFIIVCGLNEINIDQVTAIQINKTESDDSITVALVEESIDMKELVKLLSATSTTEIAFSVVSNNLYIYFNSTFDYVDNLKIVVYGTRTALPIISMDESIDIPETDIELFIKYAIKETSQLLGKQVPPSIERDIAQLEKL
jgi:hypothetical protein